MAYVAFKLVVVLFLMGEDVVRLGMAAFRSVRNNLQGHTPAQNIPSVWMDRKEFLSQVALFVGSVPMVALIDGMVRNRYNYRVHKVSLFYPDLPEAFDGFRIVQLSDIHAGSFDNLAAVERGLKMAQNLNPDVIVFTGDMVNNAAVEAIPIVPLLHKLHAPFGKFSILGNHDYGDYVRWDTAQAKAENLKLLHQLEADMGFRLLLNEHAVLERGSEKLYLIGVENWGKPPFPQYGDLEKALQGVPADDFKVLLSHDPTHYELQVVQHPDPIHLTLSGHTHGFQFGVEIGGWKWSPVQFRYARWAGLYTENFRDLYVNRGFGFIGYPGRVGILPEITEITLRRGKREGVVV
jgi:predicted MPP superfamily phosphohydrolase